MTTLERAHRSWRMQRPILDSRMTEDTGRRLLDDWLADEPIECDACNGTGDCEYGCTESDPSHRCMICSGRGWTD